MPGASTGSASTTTAWTRPSLASAMRRTADLPSAVSRATSSAEMSDASGIARSAAAIADRAGSQAAASDRVRGYAWIVFGLTFGLLVSDYMSRQVLNAVFPLLKAEWTLSDRNLGLLSGIVALAVGVLTFPLSLLADRWGRVRSLVLMAILWSLATLACGLAGNYPQMLVARLCVGIGEAAYGSVGVAVLLSVFPARLRASVTAAFMAGGMLGSVLGIALGGVLAAHFGWRWAFVGMAGIGLLLGVIYPLIVRESALAPAN